MRRRDFIAGLVGVAAGPRGARATVRPSAPDRRIDGRARRSHVTALGQGLRAWGWEEGNQLSLEPGHIDDELERDRAHNRQIDGFGALENAPSISAELLVAAWAHRPRIENRDTNQKEKPRRSEALLTGIANTGSNRVRVNIARRLS